MHSYHMSADSIRTLTDPNAKDYQAMYKQMAMDSTYNPYESLVRQGQYCTEYSASAPATFMNKSNKKRVRFATPLVTYDMESPEMYEYDSRFAQAMEYLPLHGRTT
ncbi:hypothetical protein FBU59_001081 [Linderina macrospora]|uniref:Uncharacterized protein n=1 Tax=Linderina macrospora TaxID=4868 RepID=A0ACC1JFA2_9FUNG|nr:hypothetical protein FBU59_001081 [Linderina macrospora]